MKKLDKYTMMSLRTNLRVKQSNLSISALLISIATTFNSWATITQQLLTLAKYLSSILAKAHLSFHIYPRPKGRGNSIFLLLASS